MRSASTVSVKTTRGGLSAAAAIIALTAASGQSQASCFISLGTWVCSSLIISSEPVQQLQPALGGLMSRSMLATAENVANNGVAGIAGGPEVFPTGRIRQTTHDGFRGPDNFDRRGTNGFDVDEWSAFASGSMRLPGTYFGGALRATLLGGVNGMDVEARPRPMTNERPGQVGNTKTDTTFFGGSLVWSSGSVYALTTVIGFWGDTSGVDKRNNLRWSHDISGVVVSGTVGRVTELTSGPSGLKLDVRGTVSHTSFEGDPFTLLNATLRTDAQAWWFAFQPMLYQDIAMGGGTFRPYLQGTVKTMGGQQNRLELTVNGQQPISWDFRQHTTFVGAELGFNYNYRNWTFGLAGYGERSADEETWGGKIGASYRFN